MSVQTVANQFVDLCNQGKNFDVMRTLYAPDIVSVEGDGKETAGQQAVIKKSEDWVQDKSFDFQAIKGPFFNGPRGADGQFAVFFTHKVTPKATGKQITLEEVGVYTVNKNDRITREQFFFEGNR
jgi:SnoaL-like domain